MKLQHFLIATFTFFFATVTAYAQVGANYTAYEDWDADYDGYVEQDEWTEGYETSGVFDDWDADDNNNLSANEYVDKNWNNWDNNDDNELNSLEWNNTVSGLYEENGYSLYGSFDDWDADSDGAVNADEYEAGISDSGWWDDWDTNNDNYLNEDEFGDGMYSYYDEDDDYRWGGNEWADYNDDVGTM